jgi:hypothetical protein
MTGSATCSRPWRRLWATGQWLLTPLPAPAIMAGSKEFFRLARTAPVRYFVNSALLGAADSPVGRTAPSGGCPILAPSLAVRAGVGVESAAALPIAAGNPAPDP